MADEHFMSQESFDKLSEELNELKTVKRKEISERIGIAKDQGDLSENFDYQEAKDEQAAIERQIANIEHMLNHAIMIEKKTGGDSISLGSTFIASGPTGEKEFQLVGPTETDPMAGKISHESPLGKAFLGCSVGEVATFNAPSGTIEYKITEIK